MFKKFSILLVAVVMLASFAVMPSPASAQNPSTIDLISIDSVGCNSGNFSISFSINILEAGDYWFSTWAEAGGEVYMDEYFHGGYYTAPYNDIYNWSFYNANDTGQQTASYPIPAGIPVMMAVGLYDTNGLVDMFTFWVDSCATGNLIAPPTSGGIDINDGRLCLWDNYAVYTGSGGIQVYTIWQGKGSFKMQTTAAELAAVPGTAGVNTLVEQSADGQVSVYRLGNSNTFQVVAGLDFVRFSGLPASNIDCGTINLGS